MANKKAEQKAVKTVTSKPVKSEVKFDAKGLRVVILIKDLGHDKKGSELSLHPKTAEMLIEKGIAK